MLRRPKLFSLWNTHSRWPGLDQVRQFNVLAFETSADDTGVAVIDGHKILSNVVVKQHAEHEEFRGIHPQVAIKAHDRNLQAHALTALYTSEPAPQYPFLTLLVSGGHTLLLLARSSSDFSILATTADESIGNAFDRVASLLDIPWSNTHSAGASLEQFAQTANSESDVQFSIPSPGKLAVSYSGLISAVRSYILKRSDPGMVIRLPETPTSPSLKHPPTPERALMQQRIRMTIAEMSLDERRNIAAAFQKAAIGQLEEKLKLGLKQCLRLGVHPTSVVVSGGVASNTRLRERLRVALRDTGMQSEIPLIFPPPHLCTDNAVMIAWAALERFQSGDHDELATQVRPVWSIEDLRT